MNLDEQRIVQLERVGERLRSARYDDNRECERIQATPFAWPEPKNIPRRRWLFGHWLLRGELTAIVAPSGIGKSTLTSAIALSISSGQTFLNKNLPEGRRAVWLWNLEDGKDELDRQMTASALCHGVHRDDCVGQLFVDSGLDQSLCTATEGENGFQLIEPVFANLRAEMEARNIDVLIVDPFVSSHSIDENKNVIIDAVAKRWKRLAHETNSAILLVHHTKKTGGREVKAEDSRGASALVAAARIVLTLNPMSAEEGDRFGITERTERLSMVRIDNDKANRSPAENAFWVKKQSIDLGNGEGFDPGDSVGAAVHWIPPDPFDGLNLADLYRVQQALDGGEYGDSVQAKDWAGNVIAETLGIDLNDRAQKERVKSLIRGWKKTDSLTVEHRHDGKRERPYLVTGKPIDPADLSSFQSGVGNVE